MSKSETIQQVGEKRFWLKVEAFYFNFPLATTLTESFPCAKYGMEVDAKK